MSTSNRIENLILQFPNNIDWETKYKRIIDMGKDNPGLNDSEKIEANLVKGCQSQVWLVSSFRDGKIFFEADSDASITKGIVSLLIKVYSGLTPDEILTIKTDFIDTIGLRQHLSMNRSNGLTSMMKQIQIYAIAYQTKIKMGLV